MLIDETKLKREYSIKFLGVILNEHISWSNHIKVIKYKIIGIMYKTKHLLNKNCLKNICFVFFNSYISYCNIIWASTYPSKLNTIYKQKKRASRLMLNTNKYASARPLLREIGVPNWSALVNILYILIFMFKFKNGMLP